MNVEKELKEVSDRTRRIETRLVKFFEHFGFDTQRKMPEVNDIGMEIFSMQTSVADILQALPPDTNSVHIFHKGLMVGKFSRRG